MLNFVFVSYHNDSEGERYKELLNAWSSNQNSNFRLHFSDFSVGTSINSTHAPYIKSKIIKRIKHCNKFLCLIGENTHNSSWVNWEINKAFNLNKTILAIKINRNYISPNELFDKNVQWIYSFNYNSIAFKLN